MNIKAISAFELKTQRKSFLWFIFFISLVNLLLLSVSDSFNSAFEAIPESLMFIFGDVNIFTFEGFISFVYFGFEWVFLYGIFLLSKSANIIAGDIKNRSIELYISKPRSRVEFILGKWLTHMFFTIIIICFSMFVGVGFVSIKYGINTDEINILYFVYTFLWQMFVIISLQSIGILCSVKSKHTDAVQYAFVIMMFMFILGNMSGFFNENIQWVKYLSVFTYFRPIDLLIYHDTSGVFRDIMILFIFSITMVTISAIQFKEKDISI